MSRIFAVIKRDFLHVRGNAIALLVCMGLVVMPSLYAWFNIAGGWDPYGNTGQVQVALANSDEGMKGGIIPFRVNVGERVIDSLAGSQKIGYVVTSEEEAIEGVRSGKYYAAVVIPKNFSANLMSVLSRSSTHPALDYYVNEKRNAIASIVTGKASSSVQTMVNEGFTEAVTQVGTDLFDELSGTLDDEGLLSVTGELSDVLDDSLRALRRSSDDIAAYKEVVASIRGVLDSSAELVGDGSVSLDAASMLMDAAEGVRGFDEAASTAESAASDAIDEGEAAVSDLEVAIDEAFVTAGDKADDLDAALAKAIDVATARRDDLQTFYDKLDALNGQVYSLEASLETDSADIEYVHTVKNDLSDLLTRTNNAIGYMDDLISTAQTTLDDLRASRADVDTSRQELADLAAQAEESIQEVRDSWENDLSGSLGDIADVIDDAAVRVSGISDTLHDEAGKVSTKVSDASTDLKELEETLDSAAQKLSDTAQKLEDLRTRLSKAASSGDVELVRTILGSDSAALVDFLSSPVELEREAFFAVENNGSAMTPYYTTMALWVGGTLMGVLLYVGLSKRAIEETGAKPRHAYFGRLAFFLAIGALQSTMLLLGDMYFLGVQCENPLLFLLTGWLASTVFINIIYSLATSFGDVGKAIAVFIMVVQVAGSGGTFPVQMLPKPFQIAYPILPFVHSENAMRAAMFGTNGNDWLQSMGILACFLVPALLLGLVLRKPLVGVNEWIEEKMEETELM